MNEWMNERVVYHFQTSKKLLQQQMTEWLNEWMNEYMTEWMNEYMNIWLNE